MSRFTNTTKRTTHPRLLALGKVYNEYTNKLQQGIPMFLQKNIGNCRKMLKSCCQAVAEPGQLSPTYPQCFLQYQQQQRQHKQDQTGTRWVREMNSALVKGPRGSRDRLPGPRWSRGRPAGSQGSRGRPTGSLGSRDGPTGFQRVKG